MKIILCIALLALAGCVTAPPVPQTVCDVVRAGKPQGLPEKEWAGIEMACLVERVDAILNDETVPPPHSED